MSEHTQIADALIRLRKGIEYQPGHIQTSREERMIIMESAAEAMSKISPQQGKTFDYLLGLVPAQMKLQIEFDRGADVEVTLFVFVDGEPVTWNGVADNVTQALEQALRKVAIYAAVHARCIDSTRSSTKIPDEPPPRDRQLNRKTPVELGGQQFESKAAAIRWLIQQDEFRQAEDIDVAGLVGCSESYVAATRTKMENKG